MSSVTKSWAPTKSDPLAAAARKRKILLVALVVLLAAILAFELPRLMHRSSGPVAAPEDAAATADAQPTGLVTDQVGTASQTAAGADATSAQTTASADAATAPADATAASGTTTPVTTAPTVSKKVVLAMRHRPATDPFVPLLGQPETTPAATQATAPTTPGQATAPTTATPKPEPTAVTPAKTEQPASAATATVEPLTPTTTPVETDAPAGPTGVATATAPEKAQAAPAVVKPPAEQPSIKPAVVEPDAAVVYANGKKQAVAVHEYFRTGDIWFQLLAVTPKTLKLAVVDGSFAGGKHAITVLRGMPITLVNTATGVEYRLRF